MSQSAKNNLTKGKAYVVSNGCPENRMDVARAENFLAKNGWCLSKNWQNADLILFNACGRTQESTNHSLNIIKEIQREKKEKQKLIVWGCLPKIDPETLQKEFKGLVSAGSELTELPQLVGASEEVNQTTSNNLGNGNFWPLTKKNAPGLPRYNGNFLDQICRKPVLSWEGYLNSRFNLVRDKDQSIYYIKISTGCQSNCAYCAIQKSRGVTKSKPITEVKAEFQKGLQEGFRKFSLMGTDLGSYGMDFGGTLMDLLEELTSQEGNFKISLRNLHPYHLKNMMDKFVPILKSNKISYVEVPVESGSNRILHLMNRKYTIEEYKMVINALREACPQLIIRTQMIAGFPTETEQEFQETLRLIDDVVFDFIEVYEFSARPGTIAEKIEPKVPDKTKRHRLERLYQKSLLNRTPRKIKKIIQKKI